MTFTNNSNLNPKPSFDLYFGSVSEQRAATFYIKMKRRNLFLTVTDLTGAVISSVSAKLFAADRKKRLAPHIIELTTRQLALTLKAYRVVVAHLIVKASKRHLSTAVVRTLRLNGISVISATTLIAVAHNGCRKKKRRRL